ncbi:hypothetical protein R1sor_006192 [Riccia sorocarpa]|uniref:Uncharacterized protein n=1 Tax=Riccia sorocarpa TaxID=122646 RepID=A0ABD3HNZ7_9MARC
MLEVCVADFLNSTSVFFESFQEVTGNVKKLKSAACSHGLQILVGWLQLCNQEQLSWGRTCRPSAWHPQTISVPFSWSCWQKVSTELLPVFPSLWLDPAAADIRNALVESPLIKQKQQGLSFDYPRKA